MANKKKYKKPFIAAQFVKWFLPKHERLFIPGDFKEIYFHKQETEGKFAAWCWIWGQIIISLPFFIADSIHWRLGMFKSYLKIVLRNLKKYKVYSFINMSGLIIGILCSLFILLSIHYEFSFDRHHKNSKNAPPDRSL